MGKESRRAYVKLPEGAQPIVTSPAGRLLVAADAKGNFTVIDLDNGKPRFRSETLLHPGGRVQEEIGDGPRMLRPAGWAEPPPGFTLTFSADGACLAGLIANGKQTAIWKTDDGKKLHTLPAPENLACLALSHDGKTVLTSNGDGSRVAFIDPASGKVTQTLLSAAAPKTKPEILPPGKQARTWTTYAARALCLSPDGKTLALIRIATSTTTFPFGPPRPQPPVITYSISICDLPAKKVVHEFAGGPSDAMTFSPDGKLLAGGHSAGIWVYDVANHRVHRRTDRGGDIKALLFAPDCQTLITGSTKATIVVWDVESLKKLQPPK